MKRRRVRLAIGAIVMMCVMAFYVGCGPEPGTATPEPTGNMRETSSGISGIAYLGPTSLEEQILRSSAIARVRFSSVKQVVEYVRMEPYPGVYVGALEFTFEVLEYLKGSGGTEVKAVAYDGDKRYPTRAEAEASDEDFLVERETRWDDREAIVFLRIDGDYIPSTSQVDRYWLAYLRANGYDGYTVASKRTKTWLPAAATPVAGVGGAAGASGGEQGFLLEAPAESSGGAGASGQGGGENAETISISELKTLIG